MTAPNDPARDADWRDVKSPERAAAETREPVEAEVIRAVDDERTTERQEAAAAAQEDARRTLADNAAALESAEADRVSRHVALGDVRETAQEVAEGVDKLDRGIKETMKAADWEPPKI